MSTWIGFVRARRCSAWKWGGVVLAALVATALGCQNKTGSSGAAGGYGASDSDHPTGTASSQPPARKSDHPTGRTPRPSDHPTSPVSPSGSTSSTRPLGPDEVCLLPPEPDPNAITRVQKGGKLTPFALTDVRTNRVVSSESGANKYLLIHYWASW